MKRYQFYAGGQWRDPSKGIWFDAENPYDGSRWCSIPRCGEADVELAIDAAADAFDNGPWPRMTGAERGACLRRAGENLIQSAQRLAELETRDTGKRIVETTAQMQFIVQWFDYYAGLADKIEGRVMPESGNNAFSYTFHEALGVIAVITPWNSPVMIAIWKILPALAAGNTVIIKPSEHASASTIELMKIFEDAEFPPGVVNVVTGAPADFGDILVSHPSVAKITFTGSESGGRVINTLAAASFKQVTMELGGKSPQIVFADANIENAVNGVISGIFQSNGQTCVAGSRLYLHRSIAEQFLARLKDSIGGLRMGDPMDEATQIGPIANRLQFEKVTSFIEEAKQAGAECICGGNVVADIGQGLFIEPTIFTGVTHEMRIVCEEVFGPVLVVMEFDNEDEVVELANDSRFGLAAGIWTQSIQRAHRLVKKIASGTVYVNTYRAVSVYSPVGGYKASGFGRENGIEAMYEFMQSKSVWIGTGEKLANPLLVKGKS